MEKQIKLFTPTESELIGLDNLITNVPELQELIEESGYNIQTINNGVKNLKGLPVSYKDMIINFFKALNNTHITKEIYKYSNFRNQEIIDKLLAREQEYKKIIIKQASKHNDESGIEEMNKMFSTMIIETKDNKKISK